MIKKIDKLLARMINKKEEGLKSVKSEMKKKLQKEKISLVKADI